MSARITIQSGIASGTSHRINGRVARVGSDPQSEVCVPSAEIPSHALTLEFRDDSCLVYNRCRESVYVGAQVVEPEQVLEWPETDILQLGPDTELLLDFDPDNELGYHPAEIEDVDPPSDEKNDKQDSANPELVKPKANSGSKTVVQLVVIVACLAGCALLLIRDQNRKAGVNSGPGFSEVIAAALADNDVSPALLRRIQYAEAQRIRGRDDEAVELFQLIRDDLLNQMGEFDQTEDTPERQLIRLVQLRLTE
jgi:hypothetical protein